MFLHRMVRKFLVAQSEHVPHRTIPPQLRKFKLEKQNKTLVHYKDALLYQYQKSQVFSDKLMETNTHNSKNKNGKIVD